MAKRVFRRPRLAQSMLDLTNAAKGARSFQTDRRVVTGLAGETGIELQRLLKELALQRLHLWLVSEPFFGYLCVHFIHCQAGVSSIRFRACTCFGRLLEARRGQRLRMRGANRLRD